MAETSNLEKISLSFPKSQCRLEKKEELNNAVQPLLTDLYQLSMAYAYWKNQKTDTAVFDLFFRKNPFQGEFTIFAGLEECLKYIQDFKFTDSDIDYLKSAMPSYVENEFFEYLRNMDLKDLKLCAIKEGSVVFPRIPIMRLEGPLPIVQLLETTLLVLVNYASLVTTNAARFRLAAGPNKDLLEFGLRRAQGPDGALSASKYCYIGGFDGTSNVLAGKLYGIPIRGTHAHSYVSSFYDYNELKISTCKSLITNEIVDLGIIACELLKELEKKDLNFLEHECNKGELGAFVSFAIAFPSRFLALVDTYNVLKSGVPNFCAVALALHKIGYKASGIRLDSGDLAYLSLECRNFFKKVATEFNVDYFESLTIVASNDINEDVLHSLKNQGNSIDTFGVGTHLVTCQKQPALGCVFKLVEVNHKPCIKLSEEFQKVTFPGKKKCI
jgi:nicotinate phosphoribosyltransferase